MIRIMGARASAQRKTLLQIEKLHIPKASLSVILGPNGSGKSTLLKMIAGLQSPSSQSLSIGGLEQKSLSLSQLALQLSWLPQNSECPFDFSIMDVALMGRFPWHQGSPGKSDRRRCEEVLRDLGYSSLPNRRLSEVSGGERQKALLARALVGDHACVLLDEPNVHLDLPSLYHLMGYLTSRARLGQTVVVSMHDFNVASRYGTWFALLARGGVVADGAKAVVMTEKNLSSAFEVPVKIETVRSGSEVYDILPPPTLADQTEC